MRLFVILVALSLSPSILCSIFVYQTEDSLDVEVYDCVYHQSTLYCRRPSTPVALHRDNGSPLCHAGGTRHLFRSLRSNNVSVHTVLYGWRSTIDKAEEYARYLRQPIEEGEGGRSICQCTDPQSFGKNCEYLLPVGTSLSDTLNAKFTGSSASKLMYVGDIVCYSTLKCDFGLLCLDWRDICDGVQQCMSGLDEENCDKLEFNECEDDEYRCMNGMCIPDEYFLDGEYDCMDMSDEKEPFEHAKCPVQSASVECDDRVCPPDQWPCGDGQCILSRYLMSFRELGMVTCLNRRDQFFWCELASAENLQTESDGRCSVYRANATHDVKNYCAHLLMCARNGAEKQHCVCGKERSHCFELHKIHCSQSGLISYPNGALVAPYAAQYYNITYNPFSIATFAVMNGTIKCRGRLHNFLKIDMDLFWWSLRWLEPTVCPNATTILDSTEKASNPFCYNDSRTFNNRSYHSIDVCKLSSQCISAYRVADGFSYCLSHLNASQMSEFVSRSCSNVQRHRFRCSTDRATCFYASTLANLPNWCTNTLDASAKGIQILASTTQCTDESKPYCFLLRQLIKASWNSSWYNFTNVQQLHMSKIPFRSYCDTFQDTVSDEDENMNMCQQSWVCLPSQWRCSTGQCIDYAWVLDGQWDCPGGSDEENIFVTTFDTSHPNSKWLTNSSVKDKFSEKYFKLRWSLICDAAIAYGCSPLNTSRPSQCTGDCPNQTSRKDNHTGCVAEYDRDYVFQYCARTFIAINRTSTCPSLNSSISGSFTFRKRCPASQDDPSGSENTEKKVALTSSPDVTCWNGTHLKQSRCNTTNNCAHGENHFMCGQEQFSSIFYRREKQVAAIRSVKRIPLPRFPPRTYNSDSFPSNYTNASTITSLTTMTTTTTDLISSNLSTLFNHCNRGIPVWTYDQSIVCLCPPQYHGDQCQLHSDRLTLFLHVNYTHSNYTTATDLGTVNKFLVLFLFNDQVISTHEFNSRPAMEIIAYRKQRIYLHYSRAQQHIEKKQKRYFNRSGITHQHPFSIRIEAYEMRSFTPSSRFAVWRYPIYFDYLPVHRLATVLRFLPRIEGKEDDPCRHRPCGENQDCHRVLNRPSQHVCLCKSNFTGENCSEINPQCASGYCSPMALCQSGYRGLTNGNERPYCVCPLEYIGQRCELYPSKCAENPCQNGGTCYQGTKPDEYRCDCTADHHGTTCVYRKHSIRLHIEHNGSLSIHPVIVQYMKIDFALLSLQVIGQEVHTKLPKGLNYVHVHGYMPEIVVLKRHHLDPPDVHIISIQTDETSLNMTTSIIDRNRCRPTHLLFAKNESESLSLPFIAS